MSQTSLTDHGANQDIASRQYDGYYKYDREVAATYEKDRAAERHWQREDEFIKSFFAGRKIEDLLDVPVGTGRFFEYYRNVENLTGIDISEEMLVEARAKLPLLPKGTTATLERGDVFRLRFTDVQFDLTIVWRLLHLLPSNLLADAVAELCRVTRGELLVQSYVPVGWIQKIGDLLRKTEARETTNASGTKPWCHIQAYYHRQSLIDSLFAKQGFHVEQSRVLDRYIDCWVRVTSYKSSNCEEA